MTQKYVKVKQLSVQENHKQVFVFGLFFFEFLSFLTLLKFTRVLASKYYHSYNMFIIFTNKIFPSHHEIIKQ